MKYSIVLYKIKIRINWKLLTNFWWKKHVLSTSCHFACACRRVPYFACFGAISMILEKNFSLQTKLISEMNLGFTHPRILLHLLKQYTHTLLLFFLLYIFYLRAAGGKTINFQLNLKGFDCLLVQLKYSEYGKSFQETASTSKNTWAMFMKTC